jgi:pimeloyl-ACP methyl ester carboxylesterase
MAKEILPFLVEVPEAELADLRRRLLQTRWPEPEPVPDWSQGVPLGYLRDLCEYWADGYDWRATETRLNALPQFQTEIDGIRIVFAHVRSPRPDALPLILTHGWPGSVVEFLKVVGPLSDPDDGGDAFHVVCPSLPGYGFSGQPDQAGWGVERIARAWAELMARLGYSRYGAAGSDWGTSVSALLGQQDRAHVAGVHLIPPLAGPDPATLDDLTEAERAAMAALEYAGEWDSGYSRARHPAADGRVRAGRLARLPGRLDRGEVLVLDGPSRVARGGAEPGRPAGQPDAVLAPRHRRLGRPAVLGEHPAGERVDRGDS